MTKEIKDWEKDFDDKNFRYYDTYNNDFKCINDDPLSDEIKQFIQQTLNQRNEEIIKMIEEELKIWNSNGEYYDNVSKSLNNITNKIKELNK